MSGISRHPADFFQTADFSSVVFNTFLVCNCLEGIQSTLFQANCATLAGQQPHGRPTGWEKTKDSAHIYRYIATWEIGFENG